MVSWREEAAVVIERRRGLAGEIQLQKRGPEYEIIYNGVFLMATYNGASEKAAVRKALALVSRYYKDSIRVLMGGLGVGFSLQEALAQASVSYIAVVEIEPDIIRWNYEHFARVNDQALDDPRTDLYNSDFRIVLKEEAEKTGRQPGQCYHVVLVDTDNGSSWLSRPENCFIYEDEGLQLIRSVLYLHGVACFWCFEREAKLEHRLKKHFKQVSFHSVNEKTGQEGCYYLACN